MALNKSRSPKAFFCDTAMYICIYFSCIYIYIYLIYTKKKIYNIFIQTCIDVRYIEAMLLFEIVYFFFFYEHHLEKGLGHGVTASVLYVIFVTG